MCLTLGWWWTLSPPAWLSLLAPHTLVLLQPPSPCLQRHHSLLSVTTSTGAVRFSRLASCFPHSMVPTRYWTS